MIINYTVVNGYVDKIMAIPEDGEHDGSFCKDDDGLNSVTYKPFIDEPCAEECSHDCYDDDDEWCDEITYYDIYVTNRLQEIAGDDMPVEYLETINCKLNKIEDKTSRVLLYDGRSDKPTS